jgi:hypothetical protein
MDRVRTEPSKEFAEGGVPIEKWAPTADPSARISEVAAWSEQQKAIAERQPLTPLGQISEIWLYDRQIDFVRTGPLLAMNQQKQLVIPTPVFSLPARRVLVDRKGKPIWNVERLEPGEREEKLRGAQIKEMALTLEAYATAKTADGRLYVLQPLTQIFFKTVDMQRRPIFANFLPNAQGVNAALLYDPTSHRLQIWGGEFYQFA